MSSPSKVAETRVFHPEAPAEILEAQVSLTVKYIDPSGNARDGVMVVHRDVAHDVRALFDEMYERRFPLTRVTPASNPEFDWDDAKMMAADNSSGFNYRRIAGTDRLSYHAFGRAIDLNPALNPYIRDGRIEPPGATYDLGKPGTIGPDSFIVEFLESRGWTWGGRWTDPIDYQHFQKPQNP